LWITPLVEADQGFGHVFQARGFLDAAAKTDHTEADAIEFAAFGDAGLQLMNHVTDLVDIRLHRHGGIHYQHHRSAEGIGIGVDHRRGGLGHGAAAGVDGSDIEQLHRLTVFVEALFGVKDRQQVKLVLRHGAGRRFQGKNLPVVFAVFLRFGQRALGGGRVGEQLFHFPRLPQEHHRRTARALGELEHQALFPVADLRGRQPTVAAPIGGGADAYPRLTLNVFALVHVKHRERRQRLASRAACLIRKLRARLAEDALEQGFLARHQQRTLTAIRLNHCRCRCCWGCCCGDYGGRWFGRFIIATQPPIGSAANRQGNRHSHRCQRQHRPPTLLAVLRRRHHRLAHWLGFGCRDFDGLRRDTRQVKTHRDRQWSHQRGFRRIRRQLVQRQQQRRCIREPLGRILGQQLTQHALITTVVHRQFWQRFGQVRQRGGERIGAAIRQLADENFIEHHAQRIQVGAPVNLLAPRLFRAHVARRTNGETGLSELGAIVQGLGDAKVREHRRTVSAEQDVRRLDVPVYQSLSVGIPQRRSDLADQCHALFRRHTRGDTLLERTVGQELHGHVIQLTDIADVMDGHRMRVRQARQGLALAQEALAEARVGGQCRRHHLQCHLALQRALGRQVHAGHGAFADLAFDVVARNHNVHADTFTTMAVMLSGAPRLSPRCTRLRTISSGASWLSTSRISWSSTVLFKPSLHSR